MLERMTAGHWYAIGLYSGPSPLALSPASGVENPILTYRDITDVATVFVADPFLIRHQGQWLLFFELLNDEIYRGEIGLAVSPDARRWEYRGRVLREPFHLSYPHVFRWRDRYYMTPEMYQQDCVRLYRAEAFPHDWRPVAVLIEDGPVADPSPFRFDDRWWMFTCPRPLENDALRLYLADSIEGPWRQHPKSPVLVDDPYNARPAGRVIQYGQRLLRFAQVCHPKYGSAVRAFEITHLTPTEYREQAIEPAPLEAPAAGAWNRLAMHHIDAHPLDDGSWIAVIDGHNHPNYERPDGSG